MSIEDLLIIMVLFFTLGVGAFIGWLLDPVKRARLFRVLTKQEWGCLGLVSADTKTIRFIVINFNRDILQHKNKVWIILRDRIYRIDKPERGINLSQPNLPSKWTEGVPVLFVNEDSYEPIDLVGKIGEVRPEEVNAVFSSWINNQLAKALAKIISGFKNFQTFLLVAAIFSVAAAALTYMVMQTVNEINGKIDAANEKIEKMCIKIGACVPAVKEGGK
ncbi:MAG: hypothetical protein N3E47_05025 [Candidatus Bathyarchaeota archaeon]|nr:hypothetical protein [Candidatus Bathyarchaeota archaeon]